MVDTINELSNLSIQLNQKSDRLNSAISTINQKLAKLNLGLEVWLNTPVYSGDVQDEYDDEGHRSDRHREVTLLGYCRLPAAGVKLGTEWQLAVKDAVFQTQLNEFGQEYEIKVNPGTPRPLLEASRDIRAKAIELLSELLKQLKHRAEKTLDNVEKAEKLAASL